MTERILIAVVLPDGYLSGSDFAKDCNVEVLGTIPEGLFRSLAEMPTLPCDVAIPPNTVIRKGCNLSTLFAGLKGRADAGKVIGK